MYLGLMASASIESIVLRAEWTRMGLPLSFDDKVNPPVADKEPEAKGGQGICPRSLGKLDTRMPSYSAESLHGSMAG